MSYTESVKLTWNKEKNEKLKTKRKVSFEQVEAEIVAGRFEIMANTSPKHPGQRVIVVTLNDYPHAVPVEPNGDDEWEMRTIYPSRKLKGEKQ